MRRMTIRAGAMALVLATAACGKADDAATNNAAATAEANGATLAASLADAGDLGTASRLVKSAGLDKALDGVGSYTLFAPVDSAFGALADDQRALLESADGRPQLVALLRQHIATGYVTRADLDAGLARTGGTTELASMGPAPIRLRKQGDAILVGDGDGASRVVGAPTIARNGVIYRIDRVLPPAAR